MREIKFRAWDHIQESFVYSNRFEDSRDLGLVIFQFRHSQWDNNTIIEQYTGIKDKTGKEIYEGDIVETGISIDDVYYERIATILWDSEFSMFIQKFSDSDGDQMMDVPCMVLGNIHENKELLE